MHQNVGHQWFSPAATVAAPVRLFWFPHSGGNASVIADRQSSLGSIAELRVAQLPGCGPRLIEQPMRDLEYLVATLTDAVAALADRRFAFLGHSIGALLAFEVARALRRQRLPQPDWIWACAAEGPSTRRIRRYVADLPSQEFIGVLREFGGTDAEVLAEPELMELLLPGIRADFGLFERYSYQPEPPLEVPIRVLRGDADPIVDGELAAGWALETTRPLPERIFPGDHFFLQSHEAEIIKLIAAEFSADASTGASAGASTDPVPEPGAEPGADASAERTNPYRSLPSRSFWRTAVAEPSAEELGDLWQPTAAIGPDDPILTAGSCFARHIGPALLNAGMNWHNAEPPPPGLTAAERVARHYGEFSFRTGNIYTAAMLRQWLSWACGEQNPPTEVWSQDGRYFDPFRPTVEPDGFASATAMLDSRSATLAAIRAGLSQAACLVFTLGLTEAWHDTLEGTVYPVCPGTGRGSFDEGRHVLRNATFADVHADLSAALDLARAIRPGLRVVLTVSPVPLTATATGEHVLVATTYSKSVLRAVAGQLAAERAEVDYFPAYELITGSPFGTRFFESNLRTVSADGVAFVMRHFLAAFAPQLGQRVQPGQPVAVAQGGDPYCDDAVLDYYRPR